MKSESLQKILRDSPLFHDLGPAVLDKIVTALKPEHWSRHRVAMSPADTMRYFYVIVKGRVKVTRQNPQTGREITLCLLGPGDGFNIVSLLDGHRHDVTVETLDEVEALSAPVEQWSEWLEADPTFHCAMHHYVNRQIGQLSQLASDLALYDTMTRLVHLILRYFSDKEGAPSPRKDLIKDLSHDELAHMIGTVRVVVNRLLSELRQEGLINTSGGELRVCDLEKLLLKAEQQVGTSAAAAKAAEKIFK